MIAVLALGDEVSLFVSPHVYRVPLLMLYTEQRSSRCRTRSYRSGFRCRCDRHVECKFPPWMPPMPFCNADICGAHSQGWVSGYAINPARDLGPRFALWAVGYGTQVWTHDDCWWIFGVSCLSLHSQPCARKLISLVSQQPLLGPLVGSIGGCLAYDMLIFNGPGS